MKIIFLTSIALLFVLTPVYGQLLSDATGLVNRLDVQTGGYSFEVEIVSNFDILDFEFNEDEKKLTLHINSGLENNLGEVIIPQNLIGGNMTFYLNDQKYFPNVNANEKISFLTLNFTGSGENKLDIFGTTYLSGLDEITETELPSPNLTPSVTYDNESIYVIILILLIIGGIIGIVIFMIAAFINRDFIFNQLILKPKSPDFPTNKFFADVSAGISNMFEKARNPDLPVSFFDNIWKWIADHINVGNDSLSINSAPLDIVNIEMAGQFLSHIKVSLVIGLIVASPYVFWEIWRFIKPALHKKEQKHATGAVFYTSVLFIVGILFGYYIITPLSIHFLSSYNVSQEIANTIKLNSYIGTVTSVTFAAGIIFELPIAVLFLSKTGLLTPQFMRKYRKHAYVLLLVVSAIITPPDVFSQILVCLPLITLYEISVFISRYINNKRKKDLSEDDDDESESKKRKPTIEEVPFERTFIDGSDD